MMKNGWDMKDLKLNDLVTEPNYLVYEIGKGFIYLEINPIDE